jgi:hypothetical protein
VSGAVRTALLGLGGVALGFAAGMAVERQRAQMAAAEAAAKVVSNPAQVAQDVLSAVQQVVQKQAQTGDAAPIPGEITDA